MTQDRLPFKALCLAFGLGCASAALAAEVSQKPLEDLPKSVRADHHLSLSGEVGPDDAKALSARVASLDSGRVVLSLNGVTGTFAAMSELTHVIKDLGLRTYLNGNMPCLSGCALLFMAGRDAGAVMAANARLGFEPAVMIARTDPLGEAEIAAQLVQLSFSGLLPPGLVEEILQGTDTLWIETVDQAGRWGITLPEQGAFAAAGGVMQDGDLPALNRHCTNTVHWINDMSLADREESYSLPGLYTPYQGPDAGCTYTPQSSEIRYDIWSDEARSGTVLNWHTLPAQTKLAELTPQQITGDRPASDPFATPPESRVAGACKDGARWVGGWMGASWSEALGYAALESCETGAAVLRLECHHGTGKVDLRFQLNAFDLAELTEGKIGFQIDDEVPLRVGGANTAERGAPEYVTPLPRDHFLIDKLMKGGSLRLSVGATSSSLHLSGSGKAINAMLAACL